MENETHRIGYISNYYGGLYVKKKDGKYYWLIENYDTDFGDMDYWYEIDKSLYDELMRYATPEDDD